MTEQHQDEGYAGPAEVLTKDGPVVRARAVVVATNAPINNRFALHTRQVPYRTFVIGALQSGLHSLVPGSSPGWPAEEGFPPGVANRSLGSGWGRPNTITFLRDTLPAGW